MTIYLGNTYTKEIHKYTKMTDACKLDEMKKEHKFCINSEAEAVYYCKNKDYNGCKWCLYKYHKY